MNDLMQQLLWQSLAKDPRVDMIRRQAENEHLTLQELFFKEAKSRGVDPEAILSKLK